MNYFTNCKTPEEAKKIYRRLCFKMHPDKGGSNNAFVEMKKQYENFIIAQAQKKDFKSEADYVSFFESFFETDTTYGPAVKQILNDPRIRNILNDKVKNVFTIINGIKELFT